MKSYVAFEIMSIGMGGTYNRRRVHAVMWDRDKADELAKKLNSRVTPIHVIRVEGTWRRILTTPVDILELEPDLDNARNGVPYVNTAKENRRQNRLIEQRALSCVAESYLYDSNIL